MSDDVNDPPSTPSTWNPLAQQWVPNSDRIEQLTDSLSRAEPSSFRAVELQVEIDELKAVPPIPSKPKAKPMSIAIPVVDRRASVVDQVPAEAPALDILRIARHGFRADGSDFEAIKANHLVVSPIKGATKSAGGIHLANAATEMAGIHALAFTVIAMGDCRSHPEKMVRDLKPGSIVVVRSSMLDPLERTMESLIIDASHVYLTLRSGQ